MGVSLDLAGSAIEFAPGNRRTHALRGTVKGRARVFSRATRHVMHSWGAPTWHGVESD
jgi:hypothetical protein